MGASHATKGAQRGGLCTAPGPGYHCVSSTWVQTCMYALNLYSDNSGAYQTWVKLSYFQIEMVGIFLFYSFIGGFICSEVVWKNIFDEREA